MSGIGGFKGVSADQDARFSNKQKKLMKSMKFPKELDLKVEPSKVNWVVMFEWVAKRVTELLGVEDEVLIHFIHNKLQAQKVADARELHIDLVPFLEKNTSLFMKELWAMLASASTTASGIPQQILDEKAEELRKKKEIQDKKNEAFRLQRERDREGMQAMDGGAPERRRRPFGRERPSRWGRERSRSRSRSRSPQHRVRSPRGRLPPGRSRSPKPASRSPRFRDRARGEPRQSTRRERDHPRRDAKDSPSRPTQKKPDRSPAKDAHRRSSPDAKAELSIKNGNLNSNGRNSPPPPGKPSSPRRSSRSPSSPEARSPSPRPPPMRRKSPRRPGRGRSSSSPSSRSPSPHRPHHSHKPRRPPSPPSRRVRDSGFNGHSRFKPDSRGGYEDTRGGGAPRTRDGYGGRASSPPESGRYRESGADFRGPPGRSHRTEGRQYYNAPSSYADRRVRRDYPPPPPRGGDYYGRRDADAPSGYVRGGKVGSTGRERRVGGYAYRAASPVVLRSRVEIPERNPSPSPSSDGSPAKLKRKASENLDDARVAVEVVAPASKRLRNSSMERDVQKDGSGSSDGEGDGEKKREKRKKDKKEKKSKRTKKHKKHKKHKKSSKVQKHSSPSSSSGFSDKGNVDDEKRIEELRKKALESMGKKAWDTADKGAE
ncbi:hypothetical protein BSKO_00902 [Bryopsis sp. KO-2023]|nr:hypothetical protein BSKO_00902 [Bryopsis sp. KO-2023]